MLRTQISDARDKGFTLVELLIVIIVLGILAGIVVFGVATFRTDAETAACKADLKQTQTAADAYFAGKGVQAANVGELTAGGYLKTAPAAASGITVAAGAATSSVC